MILFITINKIFFPPLLSLEGNFPPPTTPEELGARILIQERYEKFGESEEVEMEVESDDEDDKQEKADEAPSQLDQDTQVQDMDEVSDENRPPLGGGGCSLTGSSKSHTHDRIE